MWERQEPDKSRNQYNDLQISWEEYLTEGRSVYKLGRTIVQTGVSLHWTVGMPFTNRQEPFSTPFVNGRNE